MSFNPGIGLPEGATCDWGDCDGDPAVGYRLDDDRDGQSKPGGFGWLPVCQRAYDEEIDPSRKTQ